MFNVQYAIDAFGELLKGVPATVFITTVSILLGLVLGLVFAWIRIRKIPVASQLIAALVSLIRSTPILVQLYVVCYGMPRIIAFIHQQPELVSKVTILPNTTAIITFTIYAASYFGEIYRASFNSIEDGQLEAIQSFSLPRFASMIRIIVPQAAVSAVPNLANSSVDILKNTSLLYTISVMDIMAKAAVTASIGFRYLEVYTDALIIYLLLCIFYMAFFWIIEKFVVGRTARLMP